MRDLLKRLEQLERVHAVEPAPRRTIIQFISVADGGGPAPWNPDWAEVRPNRDYSKRRELRRNADESIDTFENRVSAECGESGLILIGPSPSP